MSVETCYICSHPIDTDKTNECYCDVCKKPSCSACHDIYDSETENPQIACKRCALNLGYIRYIGE